MGKTLIEALTDQELLQEIWEIISPTNFQEKYESPEEFAVALLPLTLQDAWFYIKRPDKDDVDLHYEQPAAVDRERTRAQIDYHRIAKTPLQLLLKLNSIETNNKAINRFKQKFVIEANKIFQSKGNSSYKLDLRVIAVDLSGLLKAFDKQEYDQVRTRVESLNERIHDNVIATRVTKKEYLQYNIIPLVCSIALLVTLASIVATMPMAAATIISLGILATGSGVSTIYTGLHSLLDARPFYMPKPAGFKEAQQTSNAVMFRTRGKG